MPLSLKILIWSSATLARISAAQPEDFAPVTCIAPSDLQGAGWNSSYDLQIADALQRAVRFISNFSKHPEHRVLNTLSFFAEIAETSPDAQAAADARGYASNLSIAFEKDTMARFKSGSYGELFGLHHDLMDTLQLLSYKSSLGLPVSHGPDSILSWAKKAFADCRSCTRLGDGIHVRGASSSVALSDPEMMISALIGAYVVDEASFRFGSDVFPVPSDFLRKAFDLGLNFFQREASTYSTSTSDSTSRNAMQPDSMKRDGDRSIQRHESLQRVLHLPRLRFQPLHGTSSQYAAFEKLWGTSLAQRSAAQGRLSPFKAKVYLATHMAFVLSGFDRYHIDLNQSIGEEVFLWLRHAWPEIRRLHDPELTGEVVASFRALGCAPASITGQASGHSTANATTEQTFGWAPDTIVREGTRQLLAQQRSDGGWGDLSHQQKEAEDLGPQLQAYDILHHVWTAVAALRPRRFLKDTYGEHLKLILRQG